MQGDDPNFWNILNLQIIRALIPSLHPHPPTNRTMRKKVDSDPLDKTKTKKSGDVPHAKSLQRGGAEKKTGRDGHVARRLDNKLITEDNILVSAEIFQTTRQACSCSSAVLFPTEFQWWQ